MNLSQVFTLMISGVVVIVIGVLYMKYAFLPKAEHHPGTRKWILGIPIVTLAGLIILVIFNYLKPGEISLTPTSTPSGSLTLKYGFDAGTMGWVPQTYMGNQAVVNVQQSPEHIKFGQSSLEVQIELIGKHEQKSQGETFVNLSNNPPVGLTAPLDLEGKLVTVWVYVPSAAIGNPTAPNGIQVFVKDINGKKEYGEWMDLTRANTDKWVTVTMMPTGKDATPSPLTDIGFDASRVEVLGLKIGVGQNSGASYKGSIWIGGVSWP